MEGVLDPLMRQLLTQINPYHFCVSEFIRVVAAKLPANVFYKICPELLNSGKTSNGTPVRIQLLGHSAHYMAENAALAVQLGSFGIDLNFGCPSKTVNGNQAGAALLKEPELIYKLVKAVRQAVPSQHIVSAKVRLGYQDCSRYQEIADAVAQGGANEIIVHGRSRADGYKNETVRWDLIGRIASSLSIDVIANGDITSKEKAIQCMDITQCQKLMVCRGALNMPNLGAHIITTAQPMPWQEVLKLLLQYSLYEIQGDKGMYYPNRIKQWLRYLQVQYPQAKTLFFQLRELKEKQALLNIIKKSAQEFNDNLAPCNI